MSGLSFMASAGDEGSCRATFATRAVFLKFLPVTVCLKTDNRFASRQELAYVGFLCADHCSSTLNSAQVAKS